MPPSSHHHDISNRILKEEQKTPIPPETNQGQDMGLVDIEPAKVHNARDGNERF
eukprot:m.223827 g.223827  ORF g.223827 m.223827 type:complete len:54 (+) comp18759_c0_seq4:2788-2949(+)